MDTRFCLSQVNVQGGTAESRSDFHTSSSRIGQITTPQRFSIAIPTCGVCVGTVGCSTSSPILGINSLFNFMHSNRYRMASKLWLTAAFLYQ